MTGLRTASAEWQASMAVKFANALSATVEARSARRWAPWSAAAACLAIAVSGGLWWQSRISDPERLLRSAYTSTRPFEYRLPGDYGPVRRQRSDASEHTESLLRADAEIQRRLKGNPELPELLLLKARVELLERQCDDAVRDLVRASELSSTAPILEELGVAYALRAERDQRDADYGLALDTLLRALRSDPANVLVLFNLAIIYERLSMIDESIATWNRVLKVEPKGLWADESRRLLKDVEKKKQARLSALLRISDDPAKFVAMSRESREIPEAEYYQTIFWRKWLPAAEADRSSSEAARLLAEIWVKRFGDRSLLDAYDQAARKEVTSLLDDVGTAIMDNIHGRNDEVLGRAKELVNRLAAHGQSVASARVRLELAYSYRRSTLHEPCLTIVNPLLVELQHEPYPWLFGRTQLEHSTCIGRAGAMGQARLEREQEEERLLARGFAGLALQARELVTSIDSLTGNSAAVWNKAPKNLATYWTSAAAEAQAQQSLYDMAAAARNLGWKEAAIVMQASAVDALVRWDNLPLEAVNRVYLASLQQEAGHYDEAIGEFDHVDRIYKRLPPGTTVSNQILAGRLRRAEAEAAGSAPARALTNLDALSPSFSTLEARMRLQQARGIALSALADWRHASDCFRRAIQLASEHVNSFTQPLSRVAASEMAIDSRRNLVQIALVQSRDASEALRIWEQRLTGAASDNYQTDFDTRQDVADVALIYALVPAGVAAWVVDRGEVRGGMLAVEPRVLRAEVAEFHRLCASPSTSLRDVRAVGARLCARLVQPLAKEIARGRRVLIEADGFLAALPFAALVTEGGLYFGDDHPIAVITTMRDTRLDARSQFSPKTNALVVSATRGDGSGRFPFLPDAAREVSDLASRMTSRNVVDAATLTSDTVANEMASAELVHFAGHGWSNGGNAALVLGTDPKGGVRVFTATEMAVRDWRGCRLAVLSACLTAAGEQRGPVNPQSLVRALFAAGARRVVASRWSIDGNATEALMHRFYDALFGGEAVMVALQKASSRVRDAVGWEHPYYWAAFDAYGAP